MNKKAMLKQKFNFQGKKFRIVQKYKLWFAMPILIILAAVIVFTTFAIKDKSFAAGINIGIDFTGGTVMTITINNADTKYDEYITKINSILVKNGCSLSNESLSEGNTIIIRYKNLYTNDSGKQNELNTLISTEIMAAYPDIFTDEESFYGIQTEYIGSAVSSELIGTAILSVIISTVLILIYILIRFEWISGIAAVLALVHDVIMIFALTIIFRIQINSSFVAAIITIVAYSINDSIVIFDRVREEIKGAMLTKNDIHKLDMVSIVNGSVTCTLNRSINTSLTTLFMVFMICVLGVASIQEFALPLLFGMIVGAFSSITLAPSIFCIIRNALAKKANVNISAPTSEKKTETVKTKRAVRVVK